MASHANDSGESAGESAEERPSKSARKREAESLQDLGVQLAALPEPELQALDLPEKLATALRDLKRLPSHGARVRQRQYIGKLMRLIDSAPLLAKLNERKRSHDAEVRGFQRIERWRDRLLSEPTAAADLLREYPETDLTALDRLLVQARAERLDARPPAAARQLFAFLRQLIR